jgi:hypothetical protein
MPWLASSPSTRIQPFVDSPRPRRELLDLNLAVADAPGDVQFGRNPDRLGHHPSKQLPPELLRRSHAQSQARPDLAQLPGTARLPA